MTKQKFMTVRFFRTFFTTRFFKEIITSSLDMIRNKQLLSLMTIKANDFLLVDFFATKMRRKRTAISQ